MALFKQPMNFFLKVFIEDHVPNTREGNVFTRVCDSIHSWGGKERVGPPWTMNHLLGAWTVDLSLPLVGRWPMTPPVKHWPFPASPAKQVISPPQKDQARRTSGQTSQEGWPPPTTWARCTHKNLVIFSLFLISRNFRHQITMTW